MSKAQKLVASAVNKALTNGAEPIVEVRATTVTPAMVAHVKEYALNPVKGWGWELVAEFSDEEIAAVLEGALTLKTCVKKMARHLYRNIDPYGRIAAIRERNAAAQA